MTGPKAVHPPQAPCTNNRQAVELKIQGVPKTYPNGVEALKDVTLTIPPGMYGLLGPNGAGKSTLMRILATLQEPYAGSIRLGDVDVLKEKDEVRKTLSCCGRRTCGRYASRSSAAFRAAEAALWRGRGAAGQSETHNR